VGMARHCGPGSWIPRNSGSHLVRCPIARAVAGAGLRFVTLASTLKISNTSIWRPKLRKIAGSDHPGPGLLVLKLECFRELKV